MLAYMRENKTVCKAAGVQATLNMCVFKFGFFRLFRLHNNVYKLNERSNMNCCQYTDPTIDNSNNR